jgi:hypothetical protein
METTAKNFCHFLNFLDMIFCIFFMTGSMYCCRLISPNEDRPNKPLTCHVCTEVSYCSVECKSADEPKHGTPCFINGKRTLSECGILVKAYIHTPTHPHAHTRPHTPTHAHTRPHTPTHAHTRPHTPTHPHAQQLLKEKIIVWICRLQIYI